MKKRVGLNAKEEIYMESRMNSKSFLKKKKRKKINGEPLF